MGQVTVAVRSEDWSKARALLDSQVSPGTKDMLPSAKGCVSN